MTREFDRRSALRMGLAGFTASGLSMALGRQAYALPSGNQAGISKMLIVFLRGGNDGLNTLIPDADPDYAAARPQIAIPSASSLRLNGFARLHPALGALHQTYKDGHVALMHRIGHADLSLSHFTSQQHWETGFAAPASIIEEGYVPRIFEHDTSFQEQFKAASVSSSMQRAFNTTQPASVLAHIPDVDGFSLGSSSSTSLNKLRAGLGTSFQSPAGGLHAPLVGAHGEVMLDAELDVAAAQSYTPDAGVTYPVAGQGGLPDKGFVTGLGNQVRDAVALLKKTECRIAGIELGGFDTHSNQGGVTGNQSDRLQALGAGLLAAFEDNQSATSPNLLILVMSEFGRTSKENNSFGTDHGKGSVMMAIGNDVNGDVYNCDSSTWTVGDGSLTAGNMGDMFSLQDLWLDHLTDFRVVLREAMVKHMNVDPAKINAILPGYDSFQLLHPGEFVELQYL